MSSGNFSVSLPNNVGHIHAMPYFCKLIGYIMNHETTTSTVKKQLQFLELLSKCNGPSHLTCTYSALFFVDMEITDMYMFVNILINKTGPTLPLRIDLDITTNQVTVEEVEQNEPDGGLTQKTRSRILKEVHDQAPATGTGTNLAKEMNAVRRDKDPNATASAAVPEAVTDSPVVHGSIIGKQVELVHTHQGDASLTSLTSIEMVPTKGTGQENKSEKNKNKNKNQKVTQRGQTQNHPITLPQATSMTTYLDLYR